MEKKDQTFFLKESSDNNIILNIESMMSHKDWLDSPDEQAPVYYAFAKAFVAFLIDNFGIEKFKIFYS